MLWRCTMYVCGLMSHKKVCLSQLAYKEKGRQQPTFCNQNTHGTRTMYRYNNGNRRAYDHHRDRRYDGILGGVEDILEQLTFFPGGRLPGLLEPSDLPVSKLEPPFSV